MAYLAISFVETEYTDNDLECSENYGIYLERVAIFDNENDALEYSKDKRNITIIHCDKMDIIANGFFLIKKKV